ILVMLEFEAALRRDAGRRVQPDVVEAQVRELVRRPGQLNAQPVELQLREAEAARQRWCGGRLRFVPGRDADVERGTGTGLEDEAPAERGGKMAMACHAA